jgi:hypothetical protein
MAKMSVDIYYSLIQSMQHAENLSDPQKEQFLAKNVH